MGAARGLFRRGYGCCPGTVPEREWVVARGLRRRGNGLLPGDCAGEGCVHRYSATTCHAAVSRSTDQAAFAGLVEGSFTASRPVTGKIYFI